MDAINEIGNCVQILYEKGCKGDAESLELAQRLFKAGIEIARKDIRAAAATATRTA
ncbi:hypothetical protein [Cloacibacillus evryensis]|uniref:hypothetical protein n=1 Tax=Cloacibacillus evryensis TaxID=508460 RepID=UPI002B1FC5F8|nr:hypothetical protein [Cloacibacillus evryensis]MEA5034211.1 hypothetical protein [Cloacibacillus evryensis]